MHFVYHSVLRYCSDAFHQRQEKVGYTAANAFLTQLKKTPEAAFLHDVSSVPLQQCLRHQQTAFANFFDGRARYPTFKCKWHHQSAEFTRSAFQYRDGRLFLAKCKQSLAIRWSQPLPGEPSTVNVSRDSAGRYFVSCLCEFHPETLPITPKRVGIDLGLKDLRAQRRLSKKKPGSKSRAKARQKVARLYAKIADCRMAVIPSPSR